MSWNLTSTYTTVGYKLSSTKVGDN